MTKDAPARLREWLEERQVQGLTWEPIGIDPGEHTELRHYAVAAVRLRTYLPYDNPHPVRTLVGRITRHVVWTDASCIHIAPLARFRQFACRIDLLFFDPRRCFQSDLVRAKLDEPLSPRAMQEALGDLLTAEVQAYASSRPEDESGAFRASLVEYFTPGIWANKDSEIASFENSLEDEVRPVLRDLRLLVELPRRHHSLVDEIDEWIHRERRPATGGVQGMRLRPSPWTTFSYFSNRVGIPEIGRTTERPAPDPEALLKIIADDSAPNMRRGEALRALEALPREKSEPYLIRAAGYDETRLDAIRNLVAMPQMRSFVREIVFCTDPGRILNALNRLRNFGLTFQEPMAAWHDAAGDPPLNPGLGSHYQNCTLSDIRMSGDRSYVPDLIAELREARRSPEWTEQAISALRWLEAEEAAETVLTYIGHPQLLVRRKALEFFECADYPAAVGPLREALNDEDLWTVSAAEYGLAGQVGAGWEVLLEALEFLHNRAIRIPAQSEQDSMRNSLGLRLLRTLGDLPGECPRPGIIRKALRRVDPKYARNAARRFGEDIRHEQEVEGATPEEIWQRRMDRWRTPGYAAEQYRLRGHRDAGWDGLVEEAHERYDPTKDLQSPDVSRLLEEAIRRGCRDGMVHYRLGVCAWQSDGKEAAMPHFRRALELLPERYPDNPYALAAAESLGIWLREENRPEEALEMFRRAVTPAMYSRNATIAVRELEDEVEFLHVNPSEVVPLETGSLPLLPSRYHQARVTSLDIGADPPHLLSADEAGTVQITEIFEDSSPSLWPVISAEAHGAGRTCAVWMDGKKMTFVSAGGDGRLRVGTFRTEEPAAVEMRPLLDHGRPVAELVRVSGEQVAFADENGGLFLLQVPSAKLQRVPRVGKAPIRSLRHREGLLVALDGDCALETWRLQPAPATVWRRTFEDLGRITVVEPGGSNLAAVASEEGAAHLIRLDDGESGPAFALPQRKDLPRMLRVDFERDIVVWGFPSGCIDVKVREPGGGLTAITQPVVDMDVSFELCLVVHADTTNALGAHRFRG